MKTLDKWREMLYTMFKISILGINISKHMNYYLISGVSFQIRQIMNGESFITLWEKNINLNHDFLSEIDSSLDRSTEDHLNETHIGNDESYNNIAEVTAFIRTEELQRVISEKDTKENDAFLDEYKVVVVMFMYS